MQQASRCNSESCSATLSSAEFPAGLEARAKVFKALGDEIRLKVLHLVKDREVCVCDLTAVLKMPQGTLSHHLSVLHQAGLVISRKQGRWNYYQATPLALGAFSAFEEAQR